MPPLDAATMLGGMLPPPGGPPGAPPMGGMPAPPAGTSDQSVSRLKEIGTEIAQLGAKFLAQGQPDRAIACGKAVKELEKIPELPDGGQVGPPPMMGPPGMGGGFPPMGPPPMGMMG